MTTRIKLDSRIGWLIQNAYVCKHRCMFVVVGDKAKEQIPNLFHVMMKIGCRASTNVLWAYKKELGFSSQKRKRMKMKDAKMKTKLKEMDEDDPFETFIASTKIRYCYYKETHNILGHTFNMCILQDFEGITPNILARTIETVSGGGMVVMMMKSVKSLRQLYTMTMDVHARYRTESHKDVVGRFNERFILSLSQCRGCLVLDDQLNILPISSSITLIKPLPHKSEENKLSADEEELKLLTEQLSSDPATLLPASLLQLCKTLDQGKAVLKLIDVVVDRSLQSTVVMTAGRGRGKSAALGLAMSAAVAFGYSNIFVTAPSPENLQTMFEYVCKGFDALKYEEHQDYDLVQSTNSAFNRAVIRVNVYRNHRQTIQYIQPSDHQMLAQAELLCIDEAAAIPLMQVNKLIGPYLVFMSSTVNGYEGTGRSLSLKLLSALKETAQTSEVGVDVARVVDTLKSTSNKTSAALKTGRCYHEVELTTPIRYHDNDPIEAWMTSLLCLKPLPTQGKLSTPHADSCGLWVVNRDTLFSHHPLSEVLLNKLVSVFVASHYKNSPDDLQMLSDAPAHHIFCLLPPNYSNNNPQILCAIQVALEGDISRDVIMNGLRRGTRGDGDMIPWMMEQEFGERDFARMSGARVVRIATNPEHQGMGYGSKALQLLQEYYEGGLVDSEVAYINHLHLPTTTSARDFENNDLLKENLLPTTTHLPTLLIHPSQRRPEKLNYIGVTYGITHQLLKFWKRFGMVPVYIAQHKNILTGEHSCIMLKMINKDDGDEDGDDGDKDGDDNDGDKVKNDKTSCKETNWLSELFQDFKVRFISLLSSDFVQWSSSLALETVLNKHVAVKIAEMDRRELSFLLSSYDINRLDKYSRHMCDYRQIKDLLPRLASIFFQDKIKIDLSSSKIVKSNILMGVGLQGKSVEKMAQELDADNRYPSSQVLALINQTIKAFVNKMGEMLKEDVERRLPRALPPMQSLSKTLRQELNEAEEREAETQRHKQQQLLLKQTDLSQFAISSHDRSVPAKTSANSLIQDNGTFKKMADKRKQSSDANNKNFKKQRH